MQAVHSQQEPLLSLADFLCAAPGCSQLLQDPVVLNCGCCVCMACRPALGGSCPRCGAISVTAAFGCSKVSLRTPLFSKHGKKLASLNTSSAQAACQMPG